MAQSEQGGNHPQPDEADVAIDFVHRTVYKKNREIDPTKFREYSYQPRAMRAATAAHRRLSKKGATIVDEKSSRRESSVLENTSFLDEYAEDRVKKEENKIEDEDEYNDERDHRVMFPPAAYRKGDIELGVLMSG